MTCSRRRPRRESQQDMVVDDLAAEEVDELFRALVDPTRRDILRRCVGGAPSVSDSRRVIR